MNKNAKSEIASNVLIYGGIAIVLMVLAVPGWIDDYSDGERVGVVTKMSHKGIFFKSWEGEMLQEGMQKVSNSDGKVNYVPNVFQFSVKDGDVAKEMENAMVSSKPVSVKYNQWLIKPISVDTTYNIVQVH